MWTGKKIWLFICCMLFIKLVDGQQNPSVAYEQYGRVIGLQFPENNKYNLHPADTDQVIKQINHSILIVYRDIDSAHYLLKDALAKSLYLKYDCGIATALCDLAYCNNIQGGNYEISKRYYQQALPYAERGIHSKTSLAMFYSCMSAPYFYTGKYDSMAYYVYKAERIISGMRVKNSGQAVDICSIYNNVGIAWMGVGDLNKALTYTLKGANVLEAYKTNPSTVICYSQTCANLGNIYIHEDMLDSALYYYKQSINYNPESAPAWIGIGKVLIKKDQTNEAIASLEKAIEVTEKSNNYSDKMDAQSTLGVLYYKLNDHKKATSLLYTVVQQAEKKKGVGLENVYEAYNTLSSIKVAAGQYKQAYIYQQKSRELLDSLHEQARVKAIYDLESKSRVVKNDKEVVEKQLLLTQREKQLRENNFWMGGIGICSILFAISLVSVYRSSKSKQRLQSEKIYSMQQEQEISNLKSMIMGEEKERSRLARELHDGIMVQLSTVKMNLKTLPEPYRELNSSEYVQTPYYQQIIQQMEDATKELRLTAHNLMPDILLQGGLVEALFYFCNTLQQHAPFTISFQQHGDIPRMQQEFELSIYRIVQELVQNILKHASATKVIVQLAQLDNNILTITVEDNGIGFNIDQLQERAGMGLKSISTRASALNGMMDLRSNEGGTTVYLEFDIHAVH